MQEYEIFRMPVQISKERKQARRSMYTVYLFIIVIKFKVNSCLHCIVFPFVLVVVIPFVFV